MAKGTRSLTEFRGQAGLLWPLIEQHPDVSARWATLAKTVAAVRQLLFHFLPRFGPAIAFRAVYFQGNPVLEELPSHEAFLPFPGKGDADAPSLPCSLLY
jgi:hypothetical protein